MPYSCSNNINDIIIVATSIWWNINNNDISTTTNIYKEKPLTSALLLLVFRLYEIYEKIIQNLFFL